MKFFVVKYWDAYGETNISGVWYKNRKTASRKGKKIFGKRFCGTKTVWARRK